MVPIVWAHPPNRNACHWYIQPTACERTPNAPRFQAMHMPCWTASSPPSAVPAPQLSAFFFFFKAYSKRPGYALYNVNPIFSSSSGWSIRSPYPLHHIPGAHAARWRRREKVERRRAIGFLCLRCHLRVKQVVGGVVQLERSGLQVCTFTCQVGRQGPAGAGIHTIKAGKTRPEEAVVHILDLEQPGLKVRAFVYVFITWYSYICSELGNDAPACGLAKMSRDQATR